MPSQFMHIHGRVGRDPEIKQFNGKNGGTFSVARFSLAVDHRFDDGVDWFDCEVMGDKRVPFVTQYIRKGQEVSLYGRHESRKYDKDGESRTYWSFKVDNITLCGKKSDNTNSEPVSSGLPGSISTVAAEPDEPKNGEDIIRQTLGDDEDLPF